MTSQPSQPRLARRRRAFQAPRCGGLRRRRKDRCGAESYMVKATGAGDRGGRARTENTPQIAGAVINPGSPPRAAACRSRDRATIDKFVHRAGAAARHDRVGERAGGGQHQHEFQEVLHGSPANEAGHGGYSNGSYTSASATNTGNSNGFQERRKPSSRPSKRARRSSSKASITSRSHAPVRRARGNTARKAEENVVFSSPGCLPAASWSAPPAPKRGEVVSNPTECELEVLLNGATPETNESAWRCAGFRRSCG